MGLHNVVPEAKGILGKTMGREVMKMNILEKLEDGGIAKIKRFSERYIQPKLCKLIAIAMLPVITQVSVNAQITDFSWVFSWDFLLATDGTSLEGLQQKEDHFQCPENLLSSHLTYSIWTKCQMYALLCTRTESIREKGESCPRRRVIW